MDDSHARRGQRPLPTEWFINRELSWLAFNARVLEEAQDSGNPLLERVKFLAIVDSNLAEFFGIRVARLKQEAEASLGARGPDGMTPAETLVAIESLVRKQVGTQYACWNDELVPALEKEGIAFRGPDELDPRQRDWLKGFVEHEILPVLTPISLDPSHPLPGVANLSLNIAALLAVDDPDQPDRLGIVQVPRILPRIVRVPSDGAARVYVFLAEAIRWQIFQLFEGAQILDHTAFRLTRNSNLYVDEEEIENLRAAIETELRRRRWGEAVRLEVSAPIGERLRQELLEVFQLEPSDLYEYDGPVNLSRLMHLLDLEDRAALKFPPYLAPMAPALREPSKIFASIRASDVLLHHPFDSFDSVEDFLKQAADDPRVLAVKQSLYRTGEDSSIARALVAAAERGKQVTAVVELKARFDEERNLHWARRMEEAGVQMVYGLVGLKTHCKLSLIVRREDDGLRRYAHIGTGNYHPSTARQYTDLGLFTADPEIAAEVASVFNLITSLGTRATWQHLLVSPMGLRKGMLERIEREAAHARDGRPASIVAKLNAVLDPEVIDALYRASQAGVAIDLIVRGICALRPGVRGLSDTVRVRSIVDRFLEHSRIVRFENAGQPEFWIGSADWMPRNLDERVEVMCRVRSPSIAARLEDILTIYRSDEVKARQMQSDGSYLRPRGARGVQAQLAFMQRSSALALRADDALESPVA
jgi:polyphosphate kinase